MTLLLAALIAAPVLALGFLTTLHFIHRDRSNANRARRLAELREFHLWPRTDLHGFLWTKLDLALEVWRLQERRKIVVWFGDPADALFGRRQRFGASPDAAATLIRLLTRHAIEMRQVLPALSEAVTERVLAGGDLLRALREAVWPFDDLWREQVRRHFARQNSRQLERILEAHVTRRLLDL